MRAHIWLAGLLGTLGVIQATTQPNTEIAEEAAISKRSLRRNHTGPRSKPGTARAVRIDDEREEAPSSLEKAVEKAASIQPQSYPQAEQPNFTGLRSKRLGPKPRHVNVAGTKSSTFYPGGEKMLTDRDAQKDRLSDPTDAMTDAERLQAWREIQAMQQRIEEMKQKAGIVTPSAAQHGAPAQFLASSPPKAFMSSSSGNNGSMTGRSFNQPGKPQSKLSPQKSIGPMPSMSSDLFSRPGVTVHHETIVDENHNKVILTTVVQDTPRGMKTSRFYSPVGGSSVMKSSAGIPVAVSQSMASLSAIPPSSQYSRTHRTENRATAVVIKPKYTTDKGYPLLTTDEMPFPHVFQAQIAPWSGAPKSESSPSMAKSQGVPLRIDTSESSMPGITESDASGSVSSEEKRPAEEPSGKISSRLVPDTFRRVAEFTGLRREQSGKGAKGFLESAKNSSTTNTELKEVVVVVADADDDGKKKKKKKNKKEEEEGEEEGKGEAGQDQSVEDDPAQDGITGDLDDGSIDIDGVDTAGKAHDDGLPSSKKERNRAHKHSSGHSGKHRRRHRDRKEGETEDGLERKKKPKSRQTDDSEDPEKPRPLIRADSEPNGTQQHAVIIDEHDESDSYEDDHICKKLQPLLRYVEYEYVINTSTGFANVFALLMSLLDKLGAFG